MIKTFIGYKPVEIDKEVNDWEKEMYQTGIYTPINKQFSMAGDPGEKPWIGIMIEYSHVSPPDKPEAYKTNGVFTP